MAKMHLVDLASSASSNDGGSMVQSKPSATPQDKSLLAWANVMSALAENQMEQVQGRKARVFVPFRGSVLTRILEDSMGPKSRSFVVATLSPSHLEYKNTLNTFRHIVRTKEVKRVARNETILRQYMGDTDFVPAAGGGWRWAYCAKMDS
ncbi:kinesin motor domain-containing protein [Baffinella frigidus]|nr:kinesin motor domain-containing protein [Cryptophyta sp. CCMP2293]